MKRLKLYPMFLYPLIALYQLEVVAEGYVDLGMKFVYSKNVYLSMEKETAFTLWGKRDFYFHNLTTSKKLYPQNCMQYRHNK